MNLPEPDPRSTLRRPVRKSTPKASQNTPDRTVATRTSCPRCLNRVLHPGSHRPWSLLSLRQPMTVAASWRGTPTRHPITTNSATAPTPNSGPPVSNTCQVKYGTGSRNTGRNSGLRSPSEAGLLSMAAYCPLCNALCTLWVRRRLRRGCDSRDPETASPTALFSRPGDRRTPPTRGP